MDLFEGLKSYEVVLLVCGIALFIVSLGALVLCVVKQRRLQSLIAFFAISIVMMGYPSVKKIEYGDLKVEVEREAEQVAANPDDPVARDALKESLKSIEGRRVTDPQFLLTVAKAQAALGDSTKARVNVDKALRADPQLPEARRLSREINP